MVVKDIVEAYADELENWNYFSDSQKAYMKGKYIVVCLRNYNWYITKQEITRPITAIKALFEIDWIAEYDEEYKGELYSKYWRRY